MTFTPEQILSFIERSGGIDSYPLIEFNLGPIVNRLMDEGLVALQRRKRGITLYVITEAGRKKLRALHTAEEPSS